MKGKEIKLSIKGNNVPRPKSSIAIQYISKVSLHYLIVLKPFVFLFGYTEVIKNNLKPWN